MNKYTISEVVGGECWEHDVDADSFGVDEGHLYLWQNSKAVAIFAPGHWSSIVEHDDEGDPAVSVPNTITHPAATADEVDALIKGATITTTHDDQWHPITGSAVYKTLTN